MQANIFSELQLIEFYVKAIRAPMYPIMLFRFASPGWTKWGMLGIHFIKTSLFQLGVALGTSTLDTAMARIQDI